MNREELEERPKSNLVDLILRQEEQIVELQAQVAQLQLSALKRNGDEPGVSALVGEPVAPAGRFPAALKAILIAGLLLSCGLLAIVATFKPGATLIAGNARDFPAGSVTFVQLQSQNGQTIPVLLVNEAGAGFLALYARDPGSNCLLRWEPAAGRIQDPCGASTYSRTGGYLAGPSPRGLDHYAVTVTESDEIEVDVSTLKSGPPKP